MQEDTIFGLFLGFGRILFGIWIPFLGYFWDSLILGYFPIMFWVLLGFRQKTQRKSIMLLVVYVLSYYRCVVSITTTWIDG